MNLAKVKVEYTSGLTLIDRVTFDSMTGEIQFPPRLAELMDGIKQSDLSPDITVEHEGHVLPVKLRQDGVFEACVLTSASPGFRRVIHSLVYPTKDQRQQNGRFLQTLSTASLVGAIGYGHSAAQWDLKTILGAVILLTLGVVLWYLGFLSMKGG